MSHASGAADSTQVSGDAPPSKRNFTWLCLASLGIVYGDIGTSPLYSMRECFHGAHGTDPTAGNVLGVLSLIFWSLILIVSVKYLLLILRADNHGEGGILALAAVVTDEKERSGPLFLLGLFGAALLYADGMITPAISVMSAVEGLHVATPMFDNYVGPIAILVLVALFLLQARGTASVGAIFGPVTFLWFVVLGILGIYHIARMPQVLEAVNPWHAWHFFAANGILAFVVLGSVFLVVTGGEALYADIGHFGVAPIRATWFAIVLPSLVLNYFGQGALLLSDPSAVSNPFYRMAPDWALYPLVALATSAAVIASQAIISGAFSLTMQAIQLGYSPRLRVHYTSAEMIGQIYVPAVNWLLMISCVGLVVGFETSSQLAAAYGVAITSTMLITTVLLYFVMAHTWRWPAFVTIPVAGFFLAIDLAFFGANSLKILHGGWFPILVSGSIFFVMLTWRDGRRILSQRIRDMTAPLDLFFEDVRTCGIHRVSGTAIYMSGNSVGTPLALLHNLKHNKVLHDRVILLTVTTDPVPYTRSAERITLERLEEGFLRVRVHFGFMEKPDIPSALLELKRWDIELNPMDTTFFIGRETILAADKPGLAPWRALLFASLTRNAGDVTSYFGLPPNRVVELGTRVEM
jgi:KUP system potassium uptake protein